MENSLVSFLVGIFISENFMYGFDIKVHSEFKLDIAIVELIGKIDE